MSSRVITNASTPTMKAAPRPRPARNFFDGEVGSGMAPPRSAEEVLACREADGDDGGMLELTLRTDRIKALADAFEPADDLELVMAADAIFHECRGREEGAAGGAERFEQRGVFKFAQHAGMEAVAVKELIEVAPQRGVARRQED